MQTSFDLVCTECSNHFDSASLLLQHFASHEITNLEKEITLKTDKSRRKNGIPNLYPINVMHDIYINDIDRGSDSGIEDVNPLKFCVVTMEDRQKLESELSEKDDSINSNPKKYQCKYCFKRFGWSTDLKRHTLIHTGERPFQCPECTLTFTRNFLLQKHQKKIHGSGKVSGMIPELRPIADVLKKKKRKQHKFLIKHNTAASEVQFIG